VLDKVAALLEETNATIVGQVRVSRDGGGITKSFYADAIAKVAADFHSQLAAADTQGFMILDARTKAKNTPNVHGITTRGGVV
jgi:hypothetical protein